MDGREFCQGWSRYRDWSSNKEWIRCRDGSSSIDLRMDRKMGIGSGMDVDTFYLNMHCDSNKLFGVVLFVPSCYAYVKFIFD
jgi:hypothetical protein